MFVREDDHVVTHDDEEVAELLVAALVAEWAGVAPEGQEVLLAEPLEVPLRSGAPR